MTSRIESLEAQRDRALESALYWRNLHADLYDKVEAFVMECSESRFNLDPEELEDLIRDIGEFPDYYD